MVGDRGKKHLSTRPFGLGPQLQPLQHGGRIAGTGGHQEVILAKAAGGAVIKDHAVITAHQAIAHATAALFSA